MGLNTPEITWKGEEWIRARPVSILAIMPCWFQVTNRRLGLVRTFTTQNYTVTSWADMATQVVAVCLADSTPPPVRADFTGIRGVSVFCRVFQAR